MLPGSMQLLKYYRTLARGVLCMIEVLIIDPDHPQPDRIRPAADALRLGKLVAFPTETVYGLGANALDARAVSRIFEAKGRPGDDPLIVHLAESSWLPRAAVDIPALAWGLAEAFWPGPLTLILPKRAEIPALVTSGRETVAVRVPAHPVALALIQAAGVLVAAPSANRFGHTSPTRASHVLTDLGDQIDMLVDGGETSIGIESTVLDLTGPVPTILRPGGVTREQLIALLGIDVPVRTAAIEGPQISPGLLLQHYSPRAELVYLLGLSRAAALSTLRQLAEEEIAHGRRVGLLLVDEDLSEFSGLPLHVAPLGSEGDLWQAAHRLYAGMRYLDELRVDVIFARDMGEHGPGLALRDRLRRAARRIIE
jgi:L-threonylcarbamoyladenylate synthase